MGAAGHLLVLLIDVIVVSINTVSRLDKVIKHSAGLLGLSWLFLLKLVSLSLVLAEPGS